MNIEVLEVELRKCSLILNGRISPLTASALASFLGKCSKLQLQNAGTSFHALILKRREWSSNIRLLNHLVNFYAKCRKMEHARLVFDEIPMRNVVSWTTLISGYEQCGRGECAFHQFCVMNSKDPSSRPNEVTYVSVVGVCTKQGWLFEGLQVHSHALQRGFLAHVTVANVFISFYMACGHALEADSIFHGIFHGISEPDQISWNSLILGLSRNGLSITALKRFQKMRQLNVRSTSFTLTAAAAACLEDGNSGKVIHGLAVKIGLDSDCFTGSALIQMYSGSKNMKDAFQEFQILDVKDVASWNALIEGYGRNDQGERGLQVFRTLMESGLKSDEITIITAAGICADLVLLECGKQVHSLSLKSGFDRRIRIENSLIYMYSKCGNVDDGFRIFQLMREKSVVSWTAMMGGFAHHGRADEVMNLFGEMKSEGWKPNQVTYTCVLSACGHSGLVDLGKSLFYSMETEPDRNHYVCMVHLLAGGGRFEEAEAFIRSSPSKHQECLWQSFLVACKNLGEWEKGRRVAEKITEGNQEMEPLMSVILSNLFAGTGRWGEAMKFREGIKHRGTKKEPACSWVEVSSTIQVFGMDRYTQLPLH